LSKLYNIIIKEKQFSVVSCKIKPGGSQRILYGPEMTRPEKENTYLIFKASVGLNK
jgi:hypothetical protein